MPGGEKIKAERDKRKGRRREKKRQWGEKMKDRWRENK